jgi:hypothetical protein
VKGITVKEAEKAFQELGKMFGRMARWPFHQIILPSRWWRKPWCWIGYHTFENLFLASDRRVLVQCRDCRVLKQNDFFIIEE